MTSELKLQSGIGHLALNPDNAPAAAELSGWTNVVVDPKNDHQRVRSDLKAWIKKRHDSTPWFALSCLGWTGALCKQTDESNTDGPHYVGHFGPNSELEVSGWECIDDDGGRYMKLEFREATSWLNLTPRDDDSVALHPNLERIVF